MSDEKRARGQRISQRMSDIRLSARRFHEITQISRRTLQRALEGEDSVKESTYDHIESWLDRLEKRSETFAGIPDEEPAPKSVKLTVTDESTGRPLTIVAEGPVDDPDAVAEAAMRLMRKLRAEREGIEGNGGE